MLLTPEISIIFLISTSNTPIIKSANVIGLKKILLGQSSWIKAKIGAGLINVRAKAGKSGAEVEKSGQNWKLGAAPQGQGR